MNNLKDSKGHPTPVSAAQAPEPDATSRYVIQLRTSPVPIDPRSVPRLDLFDLYSLHCDVRFENGTVRHALRLGYFKDLSTAKTVAHYLSSYFDSPEVVLLTAAEHARSLRLKLVALKDVGASGQHAVIELSTPPPTSPRTQPSPVRSGHTETSTTRSLWSRLLDPLQHR
jgi:hypothetical protein